MHYEIARKDSLLNSEKKLDLLAVRIIAKVKALKLSSSENTTQEVDNSS